MTTDEQATTAVPEYMMAFIRATKPDASVMHMALFSEEQWLRDATSSIVQLRERVRVLEEERTALRIALSDIADYEFRIPEYRKQTWPKTLGQRCILAVVVIRERALDALSGQLEGERPDLIGPVAEGWGHDGI